ncbi:unnamed protein product [Allacma fusca]|uniref:Uncharacterized protein n=2 Tax=Allacma fusca TaxID=39272 RepID=A0A8J2PTX6_9HEXA|nr:unnamed protein product [Allacma fusca]
MKFAVAIALIAVVGVVAAAPKPEGPVATILKSDHDIKEDGSFAFVSETSDGISVSQSGKLTNPQEQDQEKQIYALTGEFSYPGENGQIIKVTYVADENGFQPKGDHLPQV